MTNPQNGQLAAQEDDSLCRKIDPLSVEVTLSEDRKLNYLTLSGLTFFDVAALLPRLALVAVEPSEPTFQFEPHS
ncbi:MAG: hypothetical protein CMO61_11885 [Verrucomicrobiales bacterium]|jgi:hypothetical protein|nr:hypothetical protein [Verrucomicrobiales bacterium]